ncbi:hypothetical protein BH23GEM10_BH23GEM10_05950 [soil metagenome]
MSRFVDRRVRRSGAPRVAAAVVTALLLFAAALPLSAQNGPTINANWPLAERFSADAMRAVLGTQSVAPRWIAETDSMWYSFKGRTGTRFMFVVPKSRTQRPLFDHVRFAAELSTLHRKPFEANALPMTTLDFDSLGRSFTFMVDSVRYSYTLESGALSRLGVPTREERAAERARSGRGPRDFRNSSPDSTAFVFADDIRFEIKVPANHELAANLKGRLLLVHGDMDNNVHPAGTVRLANALIKANKRFDFFIMPGKPHGYGDMQEYYTRMMFEYFSEHLLGDYYRSSAEIR